MAQHETVLQSRTLIVCGSILMCASELPYMAVAGAMQVLLDALEVWDYSRYNIQGYARRVAEAQPRLRYLPFSFLSTKSDTALGVDSFS